MGRKAISHGLKEFAPNQQDRQLEVGCNEREKTDCEVFGLDSLKIQSGCFLRQASGFWTHLPCQWFSQTSLNWGPSAISLISCDLTHTL